MSSPRRTSSLSVNVRGQAGRVEQDRLLDVAAAHADHQVGPPPSSRSGPGSGGAVRSIPWGAITSRTSSGRRGTGPAGADAGRGHLGTGSTWSRVCAAKRAAAMGDRQMLAVQTKRT